MTDEQFAALAPFEKNYESALKANYTRYPGMTAIDTMFRTYRELTNSRININRSCSVCVLNLVKNVGKLYFAEKERREQLAAEQAKAVELAKQADPEPKPDKAKKTTRKRTKKTE